MSKPHIAILGAGPVGLEAALACIEHGHPFTLFEAAPHVAGHVQSWGHVRMFTPWEMNLSPRMAAALDRIGQDSPADDACPTGSDLVGEALEPIAESSEIAPHLRLRTRVLSVGRQGLLKHEEIGGAERAERPFRLLVEDAEGERFESADIVFDCTGHTVPNSLGGSGVPALGERRLADRIQREVPSPEEVKALSGRRVLLVGAGHSAQTALRALTDLEDGEVHWVLRGSNPTAPSDDPLPERLALTARAAELASEPPSGLNIYPETTVESLEETDSSLRVGLRGSNGAATELEVDHVLALTGRVGDHMIYRQLQVHECYATSGPMKLAAALLGASGGGGDCLAQTSLGPDTLKSPEPGFFILGSKSYGRRNDYLMRVGSQQVDEVFELLA